MGVREDKIRMLIFPPQTDLEVIKTAKKAPEEYEACFVGRITPTKEVFDLVKVWKLVCDEKRHARLAIIGDGEEGWVRSLNENIRQLGIEKNVSILGFLPEIEKYQILKSSKIFTFTSYEEGIPIVFWRQWSVVFQLLPTTCHHMRT